MSWQSSNFKYNSSIVYISLSEVEFETLTIYHITGVLVVSK